MLGNGLGRLCKGSDGKFFRMAHAILLLVRRIVMKLNRDSRYASEGVENSISIR